MWTVLGGSCQVRCGLRYVLFQWFCSCSAGGSRPYIGTSGRSSFFVTSGVVLELLGSM